MVFSIDCKLRTDLTVKPSLDTSFRKTHLARMREQNISELMTEDKSLGLSKSSWTVVVNFVQSDRGVGAAEEYFQNLTEIVCKMRLKRSFDLFS